jgi:uncharacterized protein
MSGCGAELTGASLHPGVASGPLLVLDEPVSFWGGVDLDGVVVDAHHPQRGASVAGRVVAMPAGRGSSSASAVLAEQLRRGSAPVALLLGECDTILVVGAAVAAELYGVSLPIVQLEAADLEALTDAGHVAVHAGVPPAVAMVKPAP